MTRRQFMAALRKAGFERIDIGCYGWRHTSTIFYMDKRVIVDGEKRPCWEVWADAGRVPGGDYVEGESELALFEDVKND